MSKKFNVCVVGATGAVGETILSILDERDFPINNLYPLASANSAGKRVFCQGKSWTVQDLDTFDFSQAQVGLFSAGGSISEKYAPIAAQAGCSCTHNTNIKLFTHKTKI
jgi:aspartate-semialdehyde dehydrogenase